MIVITYDLSRVDVRDQEFAEAFQIHSHKVVDGGGYLLGRTSFGIIINKLIKCL